ncbi:MAG: toll/interleukin-1 receptor domain-containing protein [Bacteroidota bacterium]
MIFLISSNLISFSTKDGYFADLLKYKLQESNIPVSIDVDYSLPGKDWKIVIDEEIDRCDVVLVVYSKNSKESEYVLY